MMTLEKLNNIEIGKCNVAEANELRAYAKLAEIIAYRDVGQRRAGECDVSDYRQAIACRDALFPGCRIPLQKFHNARTKAAVIEVVANETTPSEGINK